MVTDGSAGKKSDDDDYRLVVPKLALTVDHLEDEHAIKHRKNGIKTTKYTIWSFLPKNLFEQFHRFANIYFLFIVILNLIPEINAFGRYIAMAPLVFVLSVTAVKDLFEDRRRYNSDREVNARICRVHQRNKNSYESIMWKNVVTGDIVKLRCDEVLPADILLLNTSDSNHTCSIETANLDGETNLKQREVVKGLFKGGASFIPEEFRHTLKCEKPNNHIHRFNGTLLKEDQSEIPVGKHNLVLRGCVIRNTAWVEGMVVYAGHDTKAMMNNSGPRYKRSKVERDLNLDVIACVVILFTLCFLGGVGCGVWTQENAFFNIHFTPEMNVESGQIEVKSPAMEGFIRFWTFIIILQVLIPISLYVSMEIVKLAQVYFMSQDVEMYYPELDQPAVCRALNINEDLGQIQYVFCDKTGTLTENKMVFKRCSVGGRNFPHRGEDHVDDTAATAAHSKPADAQLDVDLAAAVQTTMTTDTLDGASTSYLREFFILLAICNTVVVSRRNQPDQRPPMPNRSDNDADRTERIQTHSNNDLLAPPTMLDPSQTDGRVNHGLAASPMRVNPAKTNSALGTENGVGNDSYANSVYEAESPDEAALVKAASLYGFKLLSRSPESVTVFIPGEGEVKFEVLNILGFDSERKRMSVVVRRHGDESIVLYCKGADSAVLTKLSPSNSMHFHGGADEVDGRLSLQQQTQNHLDLYARSGLRTLCMARRELSEEDYTAWADEHSRAERALHHRDRLLHESAHRLERDMELLGATGIEDRLQDGVPESIAKLRQAGMKVWVLTGDKQETAVNVAHACRLMDNSMEKVVLNAKCKVECESQIEAWLDRVTSFSVESSTSSYTVSGRMDQSGMSSRGLVINGKTLMYALEESLRSRFLELARRCQVVLCCRATPIQKSAVVQLVKDELKVMTLAIGDGANDVSMIQMADVGVGIMGQEGMQAVMASDFAIGRFKFLARLLLVHGHWCYDRIAKMFLYFFYKNAMFVFLLYWFQLYNGFSGSNALDDLSLIFFNLIFTAAPPVVSAILDKDVPAQELLDKPHLYGSGRNSELYSRKWFWLTILDGLFESLVIFYAAFAVYDDSVADLRMVGITLHQACVLVANLYMGLIISQWSVFHHVIVWGSILLSFVWYLVYASILPYSEMYYVAFVTMATAEFWCVCLLSTVGALLPRFAISALQRAVWPTDINVVQLASKHRGPLATDQPAVPSSPPTVA